MTEQTKIVNLNCANCGGVLEIHGDMDRFACGYCGSAQIVERRGGTVALKLVVDAVARVQVGTDRTAAELALVRLEKELASVNEQWRAASAVINQQNSSDSQLVGYGVLFAIVIVLFFGLILMLALVGGSVNGSIFSMVLIASGVAAFIFLRRRIAETNSRYIAERSELWAPYEKRIQDLEQSIKKTREMVD